MTRLRDQYLALWTSALLTIGFVAAYAQVPPPPSTSSTPTPASGGMVGGIQFPQTSVFEVLNLYQSLTGKRLIRDSNLAGPDLSIMVEGPISKQEAISIIESSLLLNGYTIVPVDANTVKVLGPSRAPRTEGVPLFTDPSALIQAGGDRVVSFFRPLQFISPEEAIPVIAGVIQTNAYGVVTPAPTANAVIITDKTPVIFKAISILDLIDREPAQVVTRFVTLQRASAESVVEMLNEMFGIDETSSSAGTNPVAPPVTPPLPGQNPGQGQTAPGTTSPGMGQYEDRLLIGKTKFLADNRTNRILIVTRSENFRYLSGVIAELDAAGSFEKPYVRALNYLSVVDAFPVLQDMLASSEDEVAGTSPTAQPTPNRTLGNQNAGNNGGSTFGSDSSGSGSLSRPDRLSDEGLQSPPLSASLGEIQLIGDTTANSIIVYGPPDGKERARQILELLDKRPRQVYLAAVIGQLRIGDGLDYGVSYFVRYQNFAPLQNLLGNSDSNGAAASVISPLLFGNPAALNAGEGIDILPDPSSLVSPNTFAALSGLTIYGTIAESVDIFARFLETTSRFKVLARPVVYTTNNKKATILSGERVPVPTSTLTTATGGGINNTGSAITSNIQYQDVVLKLEVIPLINAEDEVNLIIAQTNDNINGFEEISGNQVPRISTQEVTTSVRVPNGSTIVLGGLINDDENILTDGIPYFSKIPVIGPLLGGGRSSQKNKSELLIMIQPTVVDDNEQLLEASRNEGSRTELGRELIELSEKPAQFQDHLAPTPTPARKKSWFPWFKPKASE